MPKQVVLGVYGIAPELAEGGKRYYAVTGWTADKQRIRQRADTEQEAKQMVKELEKDDKTILEARRVSAEPVLEKRSVFSSTLITSKARLNDVEDALRLLPMTEDGEPDPRWSLKAIVEAGLRIYSPENTEITIAEVAEIYRQHYQWRNDLNPTDPLHVAKYTCEMCHYYLNRIIRIFGDLKFQHLAGEGQLKKYVLNAGLPPSSAERIAGVFNSMARWALEENLNPKGDKPAPAHPRYLSTYKAWTPGYRTAGIPDVYPLDACQALLDQAWHDTLYGYNGRARARAATIIVRIWCAVRPSESDNPGFRLNDDCTVIEVPEDTKTGFRMVEVPPCAQIQLLLLKQMGLLTFERYSPTSWTIFRGKAGFPLAISKIKAVFAKGRVPAKTADPEEAERWFRSQWPLRFRNYAQDTPRHTGGTAYANSCRSLHATATWMGNSLDVLDRYIGRFPIADLPAFYQMVGAPVKAIIDSTKIPLPNWYDGHSAETRRAEQRLVTSLVSEVAAHLEVLQPKLEGDPEKAAA